MSIVKNPLNFFLNLEKHLVIQNQINSVIINQDESIDQAEINKKILSFYQSLFSRTVQNQINEIGRIQKTCLYKSCEGNKSEHEVFKDLKYTENNKSIGNDGLFS